MIFCFMLACMYILIILSIIFLMFVLFFFVQLYLIYPVESFFFPSSFIDQASILYLPHCIRIIAYFLFGKITLIPIFLSQCFTFIIFNDSLILDSVILSSISSLSIVFGFEILNFYKKNNYFKFNQIIDWKKIVLIGFVASISNSFFSSTYFSYKYKTDINFELITRYILGDSLGLIVGMFIFIFLIKFSGRYLDNVISKIR